MREFVAISFCNNKPMIWNESNGTDRSNNTLIAKSVRGKKQSELQTNMNQIHEHYICTTRCVCIRTKRDEIVTNRKSNHSFVGPVHCVLILVLFEVFPPTEVHTHARYIVYAILKSVMSACSSLRLRRAVSMSIHRKHRLRCAVHTQTYFCQS